MWFLYIFLVLFTFFFLLSQLILYYRSLSSLILSFHRCIQFLFLARNTPLTLIKTTEPVSCGTGRRHFLFYSILFLLTCSRHFSLLFSQFFSSPWHIILLPYPSVLHLALLTPSPFPLTTPFHLPLSCLNLTLDTFALAPTFS